MKTLIKQLFCKHLVRELLPGEYTRGGNIAYYKCILCDKRFVNPPLLPRERWMR